ncbi:heparinase II/III family protein [Bacteroides nordii]|uniref:alginate lyase family protein n=1 Tax=Bacteroides nordii TaxID=291645 RepID=UPI00210E6D48|nr:alginate lyase family protein [Bacteroides nordii]MCQ4913516.1 heparinase II/III family protein [Bacteroides nordii]
MGVSKIITFYNTLRYLKPIQLLYRGKLLVGKYTSSGIDLNGALKIKSSDMVFEGSIPFASAYDIQSKRFSFLNRSHSFSSQIDWNWLDYGRLWIYNLNYFEYLDQENLPKEEGLVLIDDFISQLSDCVVGLEPYPLSLRCTNWIRFFGKHKIRNEKYDVILFKQLQLLTHKLEYHLLGNHLLENGFALFFGAYYFDDYRFYKRAKRILLLELNEQTLQDGGNFELSPMYHCIILLRVLDCYNLVKSNSLFKREMLSFFKEKSLKMLGWLSSVCFKNGDIPLFNDAAFGISPSPVALFAYAKRLGLNFEKSGLSDSGYRKLATNKFECVVDVSHVGPDYQPGHAHADTFTFELHINDRPVIIDTGTSTYEVNETRFYERSTAAHNTVVVDNTNSSEVWAGHRVGKRAYVNILEDTQNRLIAAHSGYKSKGLIHTRSFSVKDDLLIISDVIATDAIAYLHFHPEEKIEMSDNEIKGMDYSILISGAFSIEEFTSYYAPEFNKKIVSKGVRINFKNNLEIRFK